MNSIELGRMSVSDRIKGGEKFDPAAISARKRIMNWARDTAMLRGSYDGERLGNLAANIAESTLYELTKETDQIRGTKMSLDELVRVLDTPADQVFIDLAVIVGTQEAMRAVLNIDRAFESD